MTQRIIPAIGMLLLAAAFATSLWRISVSRRTPAGAEGQGVVIRIAHPLLQTGMRESFDEAARAYERMHPGVRVEQIAVPMRMWPQWISTQLVGGTAPDLLQLNTINEEKAMRHFTPLTDRVFEINPYNAGTPLEGQPWRDTFVDGLQRMSQITPSTGEIMGVNLQINTLRLFYNKTLLREITGSDHPPTDYAGLKELGRRIEAHNRERGRKLVPIAACAPYMIYIQSLVLPSQTQRLVRELSPMRTLALAPLDMAGLFLDGKLDLRTPAVQSSLSLLGDISSLLTPGFISLQRDDALFAFMQQRAVAICAGTWDYALFATEAEFEVGVSPLPLPASTDPVFGRFVVGPVSEAGDSPEAQFGLSRYSKHPEVALDFLRYLTSHGVARRFSELSMRVSAIREVPLMADSAGLSPRLDGEASGFDPIPGLGRNDTRLLFEQNLHLLYRDKGDSESLIRAMEPGLRTALRNDMERTLDNMRRTTRQLDTFVGLLLSKPDGATGDDAKLDLILESQQMQQAGRAYHAPTLRAASGEPRAN